MPSVGRGAAVLGLCLTGLGCHPEENARTPAPEDAGVRWSGFQYSQGLTACVDATLEAGVPLPPGARCHTFRAIAGVSMGGGAAARIGFHHAELFDVIGIMGTPFADHAFLWNMLADNHLGGFCERQRLLDELNAHPEDPGVLDDPASTRTWCGRYGNLVEGEPAVPDSQCWMYRSDFNHWFRGPAAGRGGEFDRKGILQSMQDLAYLYGNAAYHNPDHPYLPPGVSVDHRVPPGLTGSAATELRATICSRPLVLHGFRHKEYNPDGSFPVITFCDCSSCPEDYQPGQEDMPFELLLAVDYNRNGKRDYSEPVLWMSHERFDDVGVPGSVTPPYHYLHNPTGLAGNGVHDPGEPFADDGLDGVPGTGDWGEGDGRFTMTPAFRRMVEDSPTTHLLRLPDAMVERMDVWMDAGIRDFLNSAQVSNRLFGALRARVSDSRMYGDFGSLLGLSVGGYRFQDVDFSAGGVGRNAYVLYGDPTVCPGTAVNGDGNHVGSSTQLLNRMYSTLAFVDARLPDGDRSTSRSDSTADHPDGLAAHMMMRTFPSEVLGEDQPYGVVLPPRYYAPENTERRYPVVYLLHGQGQSAQGILSTGLLLLSLMNVSTTADATRSDLQKMIVVFPDGKCRRGECHSGNFFADFVDGPRHETAFLELMRHVDETYRTRPPQVR